MTIRTQQYANLTAHAYGEEMYGKKGQMQHLVDQKIKLEGTAYKVVEYMDRPSGYQGVIYQCVDTGEVVVVHRGTEFDRELVRDGVITDGGMILARTNAQAADAIELTQRALNYAKMPENVLTYGHVPPVTVAGHSLGGVLTQITTFRFHLHGETFNSFGAVSLGYKIPEGGNQVINHVMATDLVSAAGKHFGQVRMYASEVEVGVVGEVAGYDNNDDVLDVRRALAAGISVNAHRMHHFTNLDGDDKPDRSILADPDAQRLAQEYGPMFHKYRGDIYAMRATVSVASTAVLDVHGRAQETGGQLAGNALHLSGETARNATHAGAQVSRATTLAAGAMGATQVHKAGDIAAGMREAAGSLEAGVDRLQGHAQRQGNAIAADALRELSNILPGEQMWLDTQAKQLDQAGEQAYQRNVMEAKQAQRDSLQDVEGIKETTRIVELKAVEVTTRAADYQHITIAGVGERVDRTLDKSGQVVEAVTRRAPAPNLNEIGKKPGAEPKEQVPAHAPASTSAQPESSPLQLGNHSPQVKALQTHLSELGYRDVRGQSLDATGIFDGHTQKAVAQFQEDKGLAATGVADEATQRIAQASAEQQRTQQRPQTEQVHELRGREAGAHTSQTHDAIAQRQTPGVLPFSNPLHRHHPLYAKAQEQTQAAGYDFSEARLTQITEALVKGDFGTKGGPWELQMHSDGKRLCFNDPSTVTGGRAMVDVALPEPSIAAVVGKVDAQDQRMEMLMQEWQQQRAAQTQQGPVLG